MTIKLLYNNCLLITNTESHRFGRIISATPLLPTIMKLKNLIVALLAVVLVSGSVYAQSEVNLKSLEDKIQSLDQKNKAFNFYLNMQNSGNVYFNSDDYQGMDFKTNQFRLEMRGEVVKGLRYRVRQRMNRGTSAEGLSNLSRATDIASISLDVTPNFTITGGKQCTAFGGFEFDLNPIDIYQYSDMIDNMDNFLTGVDFAYTNNNQEYRFQVVNARTDSFDAVYSGVDGIEASKNALAYTANWNGKLFNGKVVTRWSYTIIEDAKDMFTNYVALGTQVQISKKAQIQFDWMNSQEDLDRKGMITSMVNDDTRATDVEYNAFVAKFDYKIKPSFNVFAKGMLETASQNDDKYRTSYGYILGMEYYPTTENLKVFVNYTGRYYDYEADAAQAYGLEDAHTNRFSIGLVYRLKMF